MKLNSFTLSDFDYFHLHSFLPLSYFNEPTLLHTTYFPMSMSFHLVLWLIDFYQGCPHDHGSRIIHWSMIGSSVGTHFLSCFQLLWHTLWLKMTLWSWYIIIGIQGRNSSRSRVWNHASRLAFHDSLNLFFLYNQGPPA